MTRDDDDYILYVYIYITLIPRLMSFVWVLNALLLFSNKLKCNKMFHVKFFSVVAVRIF